VRGASVLELLVILLISGIVSGLAIKKVTLSDGTAAEFFVKTARTESLLRAQKISLQIRNKHLVSSTGQKLKLKNQARINTPRRRLEFYVSGAASPGSLIIGDCRVVVSLRARVRRLC
jgi:hypothetical protein